MYLFAFNAFGVQIHHTSTKCENFLSSLDCSNLFNDMRIEELVQNAIAGNPLPGQLNAAPPPANTGSPFSNTESTRTNLDGLIDPTLLQGEQPREEDHNGESEDEDSDERESRPEPDAPYRGADNVDPPVRRRRRSSASEDALEVARLEARRERLLKFAEESMDYHQLEGAEARNYIRRMAQVS
jgi:hypothetical protein